MAVCKETAPGLIQTPFLVCGWFYAALPFAFITSSASLPVSSAM